MVVLRLRDRRQRAHTRARSRASARSCAPAIPAACYTGGPPAATRPRRLAGDRAAAQPDGEPIVALDERDVDAGWWVSHSPSSASSTLLEGGHRPARGFAGPGPWSWMQTTTRPGPARPRSHRGLRRVLYPRGAATALPGQARGAGQGSWHRLPPQPSPTAPKPAIQLHGRPSSISLSGISTRSPAYARHPADGQALDLIRLTGAPASR
jgi:hypothetical protein